nr:MAG TPA: hypothetical protein [Caudoviricetes sp.]
MQYRRFYNKLLMEQYRIDYSIITSTLYPTQETSLMHVLLLILLQMLLSQRFFHT